MAALFFASEVGAAYSVGTKRPEDYGCSGTDQSDDTACWQQAIDDSRAPSSGQGQSNFGRVEGTPGAKYIISDTLVVRGVYDGWIDGNGSRLEWRGGYDPTIKDPMFLLEDTRSFEIRNLYVLAYPQYRLHTAFEFTNGPGGPAPMLNVLKNVRISATNLDGLDYGVRFSNRYGIDANNDQSTIMDSEIANVTEAAISIEHTQSHDHRFYNVNASGAPNNTDARFVNKVAGSFTSIGGFKSRFRRAIYAIGASYGVPDMIIDDNSEGCARLVLASGGTNSSPSPVTVIGGRFAVDDLASDGRVIDFRRMGPLTVQGLRISGSLPQGSLNPVIYFFPQPNFGIGEAQLTVTGVLFNVSNSGSWDPIELQNPLVTRLTAFGNTCFNNGATPCAGLASGMSAMSGVPFTTLSTQLMQPGHLTYCTDCVPGSAPCQAGGFGAFAKRIQIGPLRSSAAWNCD